MWLWIVCLVAGLGARTAVAQTVPSRLTGSPGQRRNVEEILARGGGNCAELARGHFEQFLERDSQAPEQLPPRFPAGENAACRERAWRGGRW